MTIMRILNLLLTVIASCKPSTERPFSPDLAKNVIFIVGLAVASGVVAAALLVGLHIGLFYLLVYYGWPVIWAFVATISLAVIVLVWVIAELVYKAKHLIKSFMPKKQETPLMNQFANIPEAFLQGLLNRR